MYRGDSKYRSATPTPQTRSGRKIKVSDVPSLVTLPMIPIKEDVILRSRIGNEQPKRTNNYHMRSVKDASAAESSRSVAATQGRVQTIYDPLARKTIHKRGETDYAGSMMGLHNTPQSTQDCEELQMNGILTIKTIQDITDTEESAGFVGKSGYQNRNTSGLRQANVTEGNRIQVIRSLNKSGQDYDRESLVQQHSPDRFNTIASKLRESKRWIPRNDKLSYTASRHDFNDVFTTRGTDYNDSSITDDNKEWLHNDSGFGVGNGVISYVSPEIPNEKSYKNEISRMSGIDQHPGQFAKTVEDMNQQVEFFSARLQEQTNELMNRNLLVERMQGNEEAFLQYKAVVTAKLKELLETKAVLEELTQYVNKRSNGDTTAVEESEAANKDSGRVDPLRHEMMIHYWTHTFEILGHLLEKGDELDGVLTTEKILYLGDRHVNGNNERTLALTSVPRSNTSDFSLRSYAGQKLVSSIDTNDRNSSSRKALDFMKSIIEEQKSTEEKLREELISISKEKDKITKELELSNGVIKSLEMDLEKGTGVHKGMVAKLSEKDIVLSFLKTKLKEGEEAEAVWKKNLEEKGYKYSEMEEQHRVAKEEWRDTLLKKEEEIRVLTNTLKEKEKLNKAIQDEKKLLEKKVEEEMQEVNKKMVEADIKLEEGRKLLKQSNEQNSKLESVEKQKEEFKKMKETADLERIMLDNNLKELQEANALMKESLKQKDQELNESHSKVAELLDLIDALKQTLNEKEEFLAFTDSELKEMEDANALLQQSLREKEDACVILQNEMEELEEDSASAGKWLQQRNDEIEALQDEVEDLSNHCEELEEEKLLLQKALKEKEDSYAYLTEANAMLQKWLQTKEDGYDSILKELEEKEAAILTLQRAVKKNEYAQSNLIEENETLKRNMNEKRTQLKNKQRASEKQEFDTMRSNEEEAVGNNASIDVLLKTVQKQEEHSAALMQKLREKENMMSVADNLTKLHVHSMQREAVARKDDNYSTSPSSAEYDSTQSTSATSAHNEMISAGLMRNSNEGDLLSKGVDESVVQDTPEQLNKSEQNCSKTSFATRHGANLSMQDLKSGKKEHDAVKEAKVEKGSMNKWPKSDFKESMAANLLEINAKNNTGPKVIGASEMKLRGKPQQRNLVLDKKQHQSKMRQRSSDALHFGMPQLRTSKIGKDLMS